MKIPFFSNRRREADTARGEAEFRAELAEALLRLCKELDQDPKFCITIEGVREAKRAQREGELGTRSGNLSRLAYDSNHIYVPMDRVGRDIIAIAEGPIAENFQKLARSTMSTATCLSDDSYCLPLARGIVEMVVDRVPPSLENLERCVPGLRYVAPSS